MQTPIFIYPEKEPDWEYLSANSSDFAMCILKQFPEYINWYYLSQNPAESAIDLLDKNPDNIYPFPLAKNTNPRAGYLFDKYNIKKYWSGLCKNPADYALDWIEANPNEIDWVTLAENPSPRALDLIENNSYGKLKTLCGNPSDRAINMMHLPNSLSLLEYAILSKNPAEKAIDILLQYPESIDFDRFSMNPSPRAIQYLRDHPHRINWDSIFANSSDQVVPLLREYIRENELTPTQWRNLCRYHAQHFPEMFIRLDYPKMRERWRLLKEELETVVLHPDYLLSIAERYKVDFKTVLKMHERIE